MSPRSTPHPAAGPDIDRIFAQVVERYRATLIYFAKNITDSDGEAEDIVVTAFMKLNDHLRDQLPGMSEANIKHWLQKTIRHAAIDYLRQKKRRRKAVFDEAKAEDRVEDDWLEADVLGEQQEWLSKELDNLSPRRREVLLLYFGGHGTAKIANKLGISKQTALNEKSHAIRTLREIFFKKRK